IVALIVIAQWRFFCSFAKREILTTYPIGYDQSVYLAQAYGTFDHLLNDGVWRGIKYGLSMKLPQGTLMHVQASLLLLLTGPTRLGAISLNFLYFALLECFVVYTLHWVSRRWSVTFLGLGLLIASQSRFLIVGGMADFRLDSIAL